MIAISNSKTSDIIEHWIKPHFASNDFERGIKEGIDAVCQATRGNGKTLKEQAYPGK